MATAESQVTHQQAVKFLRLELDVHNMESFIIPKISDAQLG